MANYNRKNGDRDNSIKFEIKEHIGVIGLRKNGWKKEINVVSWNGANPPKFDIRDWNPSHTSMSKGITLYKDEMAALSNVYLRWSNEQAFKSKEEKAKSELPEVNPKLDEIEAAWLERAKEELEEEARRQAEEELEKNALNAENTSYPAPEDAEAPDDFAEENVFAEAEAEAGSETREEEPDFAMEADQDQGEEAGSQELPEPARLREEELNAAMMAQAGSRVAEEIPF